jgi:hypothetical protein
MTTARQCWQFQIDADATRVLEDLFLGRRTPGMATSDIEAGVRRLDLILQAGFGSVLGAIASRHDLALERACKPKQCSSDVYYGHSRIVGF